MTIFDPAIFDSAIFDRTCATCRYWDRSDAGNSATTIEPFDKARACKNEEGASGVCMYSGGLLPIYTLPEFGCRYWRSTDGDI